MLIEMPWLTNLIFSAQSNAQLYGFLTFHEDLFIWEVVKSEKLLLKNFIYFPSFLHRRHIFFLLGFCLLPGFVPAAEALLFRQKDPKPWTAQARLIG